MCNLDSGKVKMIEFQYMTYHYAKLFIKREEKINVLHVFSELCHESLRQTNCYTGKHFAQN